MKVIWENMKQFCKASRYLRSLVSSTQLLKAQSFFSVSSPLLRHLKSNIRSSRANSAQKASEICACTASTLGLTSDQRILDFSDRFTALQLEMVIECTFKAYTSKWSFPEMSWGQCFCNSGIRWLRAWLARNKPIPVMQRLDSVWRCFFLPLRRTLLWTLSRRYRCSSLESFQLKSAAPRALERKNGEMLGHKIGWIETEALPS